jgi:PAS domain S-box-containing protein
MSDAYEIIQQVSGAIAGAAAVVAAVRKFVWGPSARLAREIYGLIDTNARQQQTLDAIMYELRPNGGSSLRDAVARIEARVAKGESKVNALFGEVGVAMLEADSDGACTFVSPAWSRLTGVSISDAIGWGWINSVHHGDRDAVVHEWRSAVEQHRACSLRFRLARDPQCRVNVQRRPVVSGGSLIAYVGVMTPIDRLDTIEVETEHEIARY